MEINQIGQIGIPVKDVAVAKAFYQDVLGLQFLFEVPNMAFFNCGGVRLMLAVPTSEEHDHPASVLYYKTPDLDAAYQTLCDNGVTILEKPHLVAPMPDHDLWMTFFHDPDKNTVALMEERPRPS